MKLVNEWKAIVWPNLPLAWRRPAKPFKKEE